MLGTLLGNPPLTASVGVGSNFDLRLAPTSDIPMNISGQHGRNMCFRYLGIVRLGRNVRAAVECSFQQRFAIGATVEQSPDERRRISNIANEDSRRKISYCSWAEGIPSLLPRTDRVVFVCPETLPDNPVAGYLDWDTAQQLVGDLMVLQDMYPERWLVREHPGAEVIKQLRKDRNLA